MTAPLIALLLVLSVGTVLLETSRRRLRRALAHGSRHDELTGLPNSALFQERAATALARARRGGYQVAFLRLDIHRFRDVNESLGRERGDELLSAVAARVRGCLREEDTLARFDADAFAILLEQVSDPTAAARVAGRILGAFDEPIVLGGRPLHSGASIGIAVEVDGGRPASAAIRDAEIALGRAKEAGPGRFEIFDASMGSHAAARLTLESELRRAVEGGELSVRYQPQISLGASQVVGLEALVRWRHPERGELGPVEFIPIAEETGLIEPIGRFVVGEACRVGSELLRGNGHHPHVRMSVNLSGRELRASERLVRDVTEALDRHGLPPELLLLEVTESMLVRERDPALQTLTALRHLGAGVAIDDFGTGYSSLSYLRYLPASMLKIDKSFVDELERHDDDKILRWMLNLAAALDMQVCAEGVESATQRERLSAMGCELAQGYLFARPVLEEDLGATLDSLRGVLATADIASK